MPISFDPTQRTTPPLIIPQATRIPPSGISSTSSSIDIRMRAHGSIGGFCARICEWVKNLIQRICCWVGFSSSNDRIITTLGQLQAERTSLANQMIDRHFQDQRISGADEQNSILITFMKYNGQYAFSFGRTGTQKARLNEIKSQMHRLLGFAHRVDDNGCCTVHTTLLDRSSRQAFHIYESQIFARDNPRTQDYVTEPLNAAGLERLFARLPEECRRQITDFLVGVA